MLTTNSGTSRQQSVTLNVNSQNTAYQNATNNADAGKYYRFQSNQKSSLESNIKKGKASAKTTASAKKVDLLNSWSATGNSALKTHDLTARSAKGSSAPSNPRQWNASFLNRTSSNVDDFNSYNFNRPTATLSLGFRGSGGSTAAQLKVDFGNGRPTRNVQSDNFALQAWTTVKLKEGKFYKVSSDSNDGTRFFFKDRQTGKVLTTLSGDWSDRSTNDPEWNKVLSVPKGGKYDFYMQYYEKTGRSTINVKLEEVQATGRVLAAGLNVRSQASVKGNTPFAQLDQNETFKILKQVKSNDAANPTWYEIRTRSGKRGFVSAAAELSELTDKSIVALGTSDLGSPPTDKPPIPDGSPTDKPPIPGGNPFPSKGSVKGNSIGLRSQAGTSASILGDLSKNTNLTIVDKIAGEQYYVNNVPYDQWYKVKPSNGQTGYVAAYYVNGGDNGGKYPSAINPQSSYYKQHLADANPYKSLVTTVAAPYKWLKPSIVAAIASRESDWGAALDSTGRGDSGFGHGIMQIDSGSHQTFLSTQNWRDPAVNIKYAVNNVLAEYYQQLSEITELKGFDLLRATIAAYNGGVGGAMNALAAGLDVDANTTSSGGLGKAGDYSWDIIQRAGWFQDNGWS
jgi:Bacterial SH3 domain/Transglycosylase SLT domain